MDILIFHNENIFEGDVHIPLKAEVVKELTDETSLLKVETHVGRGFWLFGIKHLLINTIHQLPEYRWSVMQAPINKYWPISDNPVTILNYYNDQEYDFKGGLGKNGCEIIFPVTPYHLLYTQVGMKHPKYINVSKQKYNQIVKIICENSHNMIIAKKKRFQIKNYP